MNQDSDKIMSYSEDISSALFLDGNRLGTNVVHNDKLPHGERLQYNGNGLTARIYTKQPVKPSIGVNKIDKILKSTHFSEAKTVFSNVTKDYRYRCMYFALFDASTGTTCVPSAALYGTRFACSATQLSIVRAPHNKKLSALILEYLQKDLLLFGPRYKQKRKVTRHE